MNATINRLPSNGRQQQAQSSRQQPHHIFVSSQPLAKAYSQSSVRNNQQLPGNPDASDSENYHQGGGNQQYNPTYGGEDGADPNAQGGPPPEEDDFECPNNGIFADEASGCESYHVCQSGAQVQQKFQCPKGTLFNNIILTCDFAHNVQCNKNKDANLPRPEEQQDPQNYPLQPQQVTRASIQMNQNSYVQQQPRYQQQQQHQQHPEGSQGPRHLKIGSQYSQHQQNQQSSLAQAVSAYPPPKATSSAASSNSDSSDDDSDDDPIVPLVPATLPPRVANLAYNQPPVASHPTQQAANQLHQSAHRSQYPNQYQAGYQQNGRAFGSYDGDSAVSPVFASHDEALKTTEPTTATRPYADQAAPTATANKQPSSEAQSFNLVINHITPAKQQQPLKSNGGQLKPAAVNNYNNKKLANQAKQHGQLVPANLPLAAYSKNEPKQQQQQQQQYLAAANKQIVINPHLQSSANRDVPKQLNRQPMQHQTVRSNNHQHHHHPNHHHNQQQQQVQYQRQPLPTQLKAVHVEAGQPMPLRAALVDLTNDKKSGGVSSEAMNDGLLLIVRHSPAASQAEVSHSSPDVSKAYATGKRVGAKPAASSGLAYAIDPAIVRPDSPVDAQLFPNVQRVIASSQGGNQQHYSNSNNNNNKQHNHNHQAAQSVHHVQHAVAPPPAAQQAANSIRVSPPLPPMEPPKPVLAGNEDGHHYNNAELQIVASSSHLPSSEATSAPSSSSSSSSPPLASTSSNPTEPSPPLAGQSKRVATSTSSSNSNQQKLENLKQRSKRTKRLKAAQQPPTLESSRIADAKLTKVTTNQSQLKKELKSKPNANSKAADQPAATVTVDQQRRAGY